MLTVALLFCLVTGTGVHGAEFEASSQELAQKLANPIASLISVPFQANIDFGYANDGWRSTTNIQPVIPVSLNDDWNLISRTIIPVIFEEDTVAPGSSESGIGGVIQSFFFSPLAPTDAGWIWGAGPVFGIPLGADAFTSDRWLMGPTAVALKQQEPWTIGVLVNHLWDVGGSGDANVSATYLQPFCSWGGLGNGQTISVNSETSYDWNKSQATVPLNMFYSKVTKFGSQMVQLTLGGGFTWILPMGDRIGVFGHSWCFFFQNKFKNGALTHYINDKQKNNNHPRRT